MRKLTNDLFEQVKNIKPGDGSLNLERERELIRQMLQKIKDESDEKLTELRTFILSELAKLQNGHSSLNEQIVRLKMQLDQALKSLGNNTGGTGNDPRVTQLQADLKNLTQVIQKFIEEHLVDQLTLVRSKNKSFEDKIDSLEWLSRYANFYSPESVYVMLSTFKEIYTGQDVAYRNAYISTQHGSDAIFIIIANIKTEMGRMAGQISQSIAFSKNLTGSQ